MSSCSGCLNIYLCRYCRLHVFLRRNQQMWDVSLERKEWAKHRRPKVAIKNWPQSYNSIIVCHVMLLHHRRHLPETGVNWPWLLDIPFILLVKLHTQLKAWEIISGKTMKERHLWRSFGVNWPWFLTIHLVSQRKYPLGNVSQEPSYHGTGQENPLYTRLSCQLAMFLCQLPMHWCQLAMNPCQLTMIRCQLAMRTFANPNKHWASRRR